jgi:hypothetical protein
VYNNKRKFQIFDEAFFPQDTNNKNDSFQNKKNIRKNSSEDDDKKKRKSN